jgi:hypothetical protein
MAGHDSTGGGLASKPSAPMLSNPSMGDEPAARLAHEVAVFSAGGEHRAECSCGWTSDWYADDVIAVMAGVEHSEIAVDPPDGLDRFMGELLDLQDDMSELVMWLAENWSADLPAPTLSGSVSADRALDVTVHCYDGADQLARVARVLGAEVTGSPIHDTDDATYRCARRSFGRVRVEAWRYQR